MSQDSGNPANLVRMLHFSIRKECDLGLRNLNTGHVIVDSVTFIYNFKLVKGPQVLNSLNQMSMVKQFKLVWAAVSSMRNHSGQQINLVDNKSIWWTTNLVFCIDVANFETT